MEVVELVVLLLLKIFLLHSSYQWPTNFIFIFYEVTNFLSLSNDLQYVKILEFLEDFDVQVLVFIMI